MEKIIKYFTVNVDATPKNDGVIKMEHSINEELFSSVKDLFSSIKDLFSSIKELYIPIKDLTDSIKDLADTIKDAFNSMTGFLRVCSLSTIGAISIGLYGSKKKYNMDKCLLASSIYGIGCGVLVNNNLRFAFYNVVFATTTSFLVCLCSYKFGEENQSK